MKNSMFKKQKKTNQASSDKMPVNSNPSQLAKPASEKPNANTDPVQLTDQPNAPEINGCIGCGAMSFKSPSPKG